MIQDQEKKNKAPFRVFMTQAYVREVEPGLFEMYRDMEVEENGKREKFGKSIGPIMVLRQAQKDEKIDFITSTPNGTVIELHRIDEPKPELERLIEKYMPDAK